MNPRSDTPSFDAGGVHLAVFLRAPFETVREELGARPPVAIPAGDGSLLFGTDPDDAKEVDWATRAAAVRHARPVTLLWNGFAAGIFTPGLWSDGSWVWGHPDLVGPVAQRLPTISPAALGQADTLAYQAAVARAAKRLAASLRVSQEPLAGVLSRPLAGPEALVSLFTAADLGPAAQVLAHALAEFPNVAGPGAPPRWWIRIPGDTAWYAHDLGGLWMKASGTRRRTK
ncbi:hypothetical protein GCM10012275_05590 [Longimycelium tulufanense]|uniref:Uncharacterized protein n=1 Tax=Longimycelium tulufanense TaxID=907463 RepID=A0A8J3C6A0_9PSEU|nr:hypothetical protein [Longimycelium tulufanense]GGM37376.1 hypothetical protein GCM10012275_05590 [Longimycelium tulufanense]